MLHRVDKHRIRKAKGRSQICTPIDGNPIAEVSIRRLWRLDLFGSLRYWMYRTQKSSYCQKQFRTWDRAPRLHITVEGFTIIGPIAEIRFIHLGRRHPMELSSISIRHGHPAKALNQISYRVFSPEGRGEDPSEVCPALCWRFLVSRSWVSACADWLRFVFGDGQDEINECRPRGTRVGPRNSPTQANQSMSNYWAVSPRLILYVCNVRAVERSTLAMASARSARDRTSLLRAVM
jgi:hypothetical protein